MWEGDVLPPTRSVKLKVIYGLKMSKTPASTIDKGMMITLMGGRGASAPPTKGQIDLQNYLYDIIIIELRLHSGSPTQHRCTC